MNVSYVFFFMMCGLGLSVAAKQTKGCSNEDAGVCTTDEYFDDNVCLCSSCADICQLKPDKSTDSSCQLNCPEYHRTNFSRHSLLSKESSVDSTSLELLTGHEDNSLVKKPLFWTSVVSVFISIVATVILIVICTCKKSRSNIAISRTRRLPLSQTRIPVQGSKEKSDSSSGMLRNAEETSSPLPASEKNFSKDNRGQTFALPVDHTTTLDSCAVDCETIVSLCQSSYIHTASVACEDFGSVFSNENMCLLSINDYDRIGMNVENTSINTIVDIRTNANDIASSDISVQRIDPGKRESFDSKSPFEGLGKPLEVVEGCTFESGYFDTSSCKSVTNWKEESPVTSTVHAVPTLSRKATDKETKGCSSFHAQETHTLKEERNSVENCECYVEILPCAFCGSESKSTGDCGPLDSGTKPSIQTLQDRMKDLTCEESALPEPDEETRLKQMQPAVYCILSNMPEYNCSTSHLESSCDRYVSAKDLSVHESVKQDDGKQLPELNLKMRLSAVTVKLEPDLLNVEVRNFSKCTANNNDEDTTMKTQKLNTYPKVTKGKN